MTGESIGTALPDYDYATIKYDSDGRTQWIARYNGLAAGDDEATALALDGAGNVYVTGAGTNPDDGSYDYVTIKYDRAGDEHGSFAIKGPKIRMISPVESLLIVPITSMSLETVLV